MEQTTETLRLALPKGRMQEGVNALLRDAGISLRMSSRGYRPSISLPDTEVKVLKPHNALQMLASGARDVAFGGADWAAEFGAEVVELLDTELDPVRLVAAAPSALVGSDGSLPDRRLRVAGEYPRLTQRWIEDRGLDAVFIRSYGATEVFPPEDADLIVDVTASGATLAANDLVIVDELCRSSTRLYSSPEAMEIPEKRRRIEELVVVLRSVLNARKRVMVEINVPRERLEALIEVIPAMRRPTVSELHGGDGYAVRAAVPRSEFAGVLPRLRSAGGTDIVVTNTLQIIP